MSDGIFISYRREDSQHAAGRLVERLTRLHGRERMFMDVDGIEPGADFIKVINEKLSACGVLLAVIGPRWLDAQDHRRRRRLDNPADFVRLEVETALRRGVRVIPILVDGATMPHEDELPEPLRPLTRRNAVRLAHETFASDADKLAAALGGGGTVRASGQAETPQHAPVAGFRAQGVSSAEKDQRQARLMAFRLAVLAIQVAAAVALVPILKSYAPNWRGYDIFVYAILHTFVVGFVGMLASALWRGAPIVATGASIVALVFAFIGAGLTQIPQFVQVVEVSLQISRTQRWLYPLAGAVIGYFVMSSNKVQR